jgi:hypothetical protein
MSTIRNASVFHMPVRSGASSEEHYTQARERSTVPARILHPFPIGVKPLAKATRNAASNGALCRPDSFAETTEFGS